ncbi:MAG: hypothetical protein J6Y13_00945 [Treponema sp.]|nr:hypothetical protein [Treponema sp.]
MADGKEDLQEKNRDRLPPVPGDPHRYAAWARFQGREDAEMLQEKSAFWSSSRDSRGDYDDQDE